MDLPLDDEQRMLGDSAAALFARAGAAPWREAAKAGLVGLLADPASGGAGLGLHALALVMERAGRAGAATPLVAAAAAARALAAGGNAALAGALLPAVLDGSRLVVPALEDRWGGAARMPGAARLRVGDDGRAALDGARAGIAGLDAVDGVLVDAAGPAGPVLLHLPCGGPGVRRRIRDGVDGEAVGALTFEEAPVPEGAVVARGAAAERLTRGIADALVVGAAAELLGVMDRALEIAVAYAGVRRQFGRPIGAFQALRHRAVDDRVAVEVTRSLLFETARALDEGRARPAMVSALKAKASASALRVTKSAIQMHGAVGFTEAHEIGRYFKRAMALAARYGNEAAHRAEYARLEIEPSRG